MLRSLFVLLLIGSALCGLGAWIITPAMAENWAYARAGTPEALLDARAVVWLARFAAPAVGFACWQALRRWNRTAKRLHGLGLDFLAATRVASVVAATDGSLSFEQGGRSFAPHPGPPPETGGGRELRARVRLRTSARQRLPGAVFRIVVAAWLLLAAVHWCAGARRVVHEWPVYRFSSGEQVLPNMSESNRDVIRYLAATTPEDARILAVSDQTLFFLSYYLWPRDVVQRRHPDSEFAVPQPGQQLSAYRLSDLSAADIAAIKPDFVLEYFEGPQYVERDRLLDDDRWIGFARRLHGDPAYVPAFNVRLRPISEVQGEP